VSTLHNALNVVRTLANYVIWNVVMNRVSNLPKKFLDLRTDFNRVGLMMIGSADDSLAQG